MLYIEFLALLRLVLYMEKNNTPNISKNNKFKKTLLTSLLLFTLNSWVSQVVLQTDKISKDLLCAVNSYDTKSIFISDFCKSITKISSIKDFPKLIQYQDINFAKKCNFPEYIDFHPKYLSAPVSSIDVSLWHRTFKVILPKFMKIAAITIDPENKRNKWNVLIKLRFPWNIIYNAYFTYEEVSELVYDAIKIPSGGKKTIWVIDIEEVGGNINKRASSNKTL